MHGLTYGVIRVDSEEKLSVLTVQDVGLVMPGGKASIAYSEKRITSALFFSLNACWMG